MSRTQQKQPKNTLASLVQRGRNKQKLTVIEVAMKSGVSVASLYAIERGATKKPSLAIIKKLIETLQLSPEEVAIVGGYELSFDAGEKPFTKIYDKREKKS